MVARARTITHQPWDASGFPERFPARIRCEFADGRTETFAVDDVRGGATRPVDETTVLGKARDNFRSAGYSEEHTELILGELQGADPDLPRVAAALRAGAEQS